MTPGKRSPDFEKKLAALFGKPVEKMTIVPENTPQSVPLFAARLQRSISALMQEATQVEDEDHYILEEEERTEWLIQSNVSKVEIFDSPIAYGSAVSHRGSGKSVNDDALFVHAETGTFAVMDGVGGAAYGAHGAHTIGEMLKIATRLHGRDADLRAYLHAGHEELVTSLNNEGSTTVMAVQVHDNGTLTHYWEGDSRMLLLSSEGRLKYVSTDHVDSYNKSRYDWMKGPYVGYPVPFQENLHAIGRNYLGGRALGYKGEADQVQEREVVSQETLSYAPGDLLILGTDGVFDNWNSEGFSELIQKKLSHGRDPRGLGWEIGAILYERMAKTTSRYKKSTTETKEGQKPAVKVDNFSFIIAVLK